MRKSGVLLHITSLPGPYGIGCLGKEAWRFVDFLVCAGQHVWQVLPLTPPCLGNSPYSAYSVFAGNPLMIDLQGLVDAGLLTPEECDVEWGNDPTRVDYARVIAAKFPLLHQAFARWKPDEAFDAFVEAQADWLSDYALYMALREWQGRPWNEWPEAIRCRNALAMCHYEIELMDEIRFWMFTQYIFSCQWNALHAYANEHDVQMIGDIPIYVALDSADVWANQKQFQLDSQLCPTAVAGVPPDLFSATGQLWGNPLYDWERMAEDGFSWWVSRLKRTLALCDMARMDHFRGFESYYAVPYGAPTAEHGAWQPGPGYALFEAFHQEVPNGQIIAEDLGVITDEVRELLRQTGYPGMKILQFAFGDGWKNPHLPFQYTSDDCVVYTGTHDNDTSKGWYASLESGERRFARRYLHIPRRGKGSEAVHWYIIAGAWRSRAKLAMAPMQDLLGLDNTGRMNLPGTPTGNWAWRMKPDALTDSLAGYLADLTVESGRA